MRTALLNRLQAAAVTSVSAGVDIVAISGRDLQQLVDLIAEEGRLTERVQELLEHCNATLERARRAEATVAAHRSALLSAAHLAGQLGKIIQDGVP